MKKSTTLTYGALIASIYVILTLLSQMAGLASGPIQIRISEALCILPLFTPAAIPGLFAGCIISDLITGCAPWDVIFGSLATLLGALGTYALRKFNYISLLPPIIANTMILPFILSMVYSFDGSIIYFAVTIFAGEFISVGILGTFFRKSLEKYKGAIRWN